MQRRSWIVRHEEHPSGSYVGAIRPQTDATCESNNIPQPSETSDVVTINHQTNTTVENTPKDPRAKLSTRLAKYISRTAKISMEEIERRVERKQQALKYASNWLCLALIAREQSLPMEEIVAALSS